MAKGAYARRNTEPKRDELRAFRIAGTRAFTSIEVESINRQCVRFVESRGLVSYDENGNVIHSRHPSAPVNKAPDKPRVWIRKAQGKPEAKSLLAAVLREIVLAARREGLIRPVQDWEWGDKSEHSPVGNPTPKNER